MTHEDAEVVACSPWREPRTLAIGVMVLAFAVAEGAANDWLSLALIDGYDVRHWVGVTGSRCSWPRCRRPARRSVCWTASAGSRCCWDARPPPFVGILLVVFGGHPVLVVLGHRGVGPRRLARLPGRHERRGRRPRPAARRVSVVSTIGYTAFLAGPPLLGLLADHVGTLETLLVIAGLMIPAALTVVAARPVRPDVVEEVSVTGAGSASLLHATAGSGGALPVAGSGFDPVGSCSGVCRGRG